MASTNKTTNYELSQFIETDRPAWLTDYNGDMRKLDTALKAVSDTASGASGGISSLTDRMTAAEGAITTNANDITALDARADALEAQAQNITGAIGNINTEQITQNAGIEAATQLGYNLARPYDSASTYAVGAYVLFQNTLYKCITAVTTGEAFDPIKWLAIKATDELNSGGEIFQILPNNTITLSNFDVINLAGNTIPHTAASISIVGIFRFNGILFVNVSAYASIQHTGTSYPLIEILKITADTNINIRPFVRGLFTGINTGSSGVAISDYANKWPNNHLLEDNTHTTIEGGKISIGFRLGAETTSDDIPLSFALDATFVLPRSAVI